MKPGDCQPLQCDAAVLRLTEARDPAVSFGRLNQIRAELRHCAPCLQAFEVEVKFRATVATRCVDYAPEGLQVRITETLSRIDLSQVNVTDL